MAELVIKDVDDATLDKLAKQAEAFGRSLQDELKIILSRAALYAEVRKSAAEMRAKLAERHHTDSVELLREDRSR
jgi:plasmid stability protein